MKNSAKQNLLCGCALLMLFAAWTAMVCCVDVQPVGVNGTDIGLATLNTWVRDRIGVHMALYHLTDWLGLVPIAVCAVFGCIGGIRLLRGKPVGVYLLLGGYYLAVMLCYLMFEQLSPHYRPMLLGGRMELSYPSSTTLLMVSVMPTLAERLRTPWLHRAVGVFTASMVLLRLGSGVHWLADIVGGALAGQGLYSLYRAAALHLAKGK